MQSLFSKLFLLSLPEFPNSTIKLLSWLFLISSTPISRNSSHLSIQSHPLNCHISGTHSYLLIEGIWYKWCIRAIESSLTCISPPHSHYFLRLHSLQPPSTIHIYLFSNFKLRLYLLLALSRNRSYYLLCLKFSLQCELIALLSSLIPDPHVLEYLHSLSHETWRSPLPSS